MATTSVLGGVVQRREDPALIKGKGVFVDDIVLPGMLHAAFVRSPFAHASITSIDPSAALAMPGVKAVFTADDVRHLGVLPAQAAALGRPLLADGEANHMG
jgi:carbon-monoxide dehydrogenase large subunit